MLRNSKYKKKIWETSTLSSRITSWISNIDIILDNANYEFKQNFLSNIIVQSNHLKKNIKWKDYAVLSNNPPALELPGLSSKEVAKYVRKAYLEYYLNPAYIFSKIISLKNTRDIKNLFEGAKILLKIT